MTTDPAERWIDPVREPEDRFFTQMFATTRAIVVLRGADPEEAVARAAEAWDAGVEAVEVTIAERRDVPALEAVADAARARGMTVGAGSIYRPAQVHVAVEAGADYLVSPGIDRDVSLACRARGLPHLPGVSTASEIIQAERLGHVWLKVFPARELGSAWISAMTGPFPWARWVATGGVTAESGPRFLAAGCAAVGMGRKCDDWSWARVS